MCADEKHFAWTAAPKLRNRVEEVPGGEGKGDFCTIMINEIDFDVVNFDCARSVCARVFHEIEYARSKNRCARIDVDIARDRFQKIDVPESMSTSRVFPWSFPRAIFVAFGVPYRSCPTSSVD